MKKILLLFLLALTVSMTSCKTKYPNLENGLYAEFVTNKGTFVAKFYYEATPLTVANFIELAEGRHEMVDSAYAGKPYFNGLTFHRVIKEFMIQGGDPSGDGSGNPGYRFPDEIVDTLKHTKKGLLSMANAGVATNGSQFFITLKETPWLDGKHTVFGEIVLGQEIVDSIGTVETTKPGDKPVEAIVIQEVNIINKGVTVPSFTSEMEKIEAAKKEREDRLYRVAAATARGLSDLKELADELPSGLKMFWRHNEKGIKPKEGSKIRMNYSGYLTDGTLFDTNILEIAEKYDAVDPQKLDRGLYGPTVSDYSKEARLVPGFREGLLQMSVGDKAILYIPSHLAFGEQGIRDVIPPKADLIFELELVEIFVSD
ncbi:MAG: peptidylprolyl isomerase [Bacteroidetes bacterium]|nr:MAG: peptidylprolyl isomerase [Bacteroidota bacterium]